MYDLIAHIIAVVARPYGNGGGIFVDAGRRHSIVIDVGVVGPVEQVLVDRLAASGIDRWCVRRRRARCAAAAARARSPARRLGPPPLELFVAQRRRHQVEAAQFKARAACSFRATQGAIGRTK